MTGRQQNVVLAIALAIVAFAIFAPSIGNQFVWDDPIVFDRQLPFFDSLHNVFFPPSGIPQFGDHYYRPVIVLSYLLDEAVASWFWSPESHEAGRRAVFHFTPVLYHAIATALVFWFGLALFGGVREKRLHSGRWASAAAALLFAAHPVHVESVAWMAGRSDTLCAIFVLGAAIAYVGYRRHGGAVRFWSAVALSFVGMLTKETAIGVWLFFPVVDLLVLPVSPEQAPAVDRAERRRREREQQKRSKSARAAAPAAPGWYPAWLTYVALAVVTVVYLALRRAGMGTVTSPSMSRLPRVGRLFGALGWYLKKSVWPPPQSVFPSDVPGGLAAALGLVVTVAAVAVLAWLALKRRLVPEVLAGTFFFATLAPSLLIALYPISKTPLAERYLYMPTAGLLLLACFALRHVTSKLAWPEPAHAAVPIVVAAAIAVPAAWASVARQGVWADNLPFWLDAVEKAPDQGVPHLHLGIYYTENGKYDLALHEYQRALDTYREDASLAKAHNDMGSLLLRMNRKPEAIEHFRKAIALDPNYETPHYNWAIALMSDVRQIADHDARQQRIDEGLAQYREALRLNPRYVKAHLQYGMLLVQTGNPQEGVQHLREVVALAPASAEAKTANEILAKVSAARPAAR